MRTLWTLGAWLGVTGAATAYLSLSFFGDEPTLFLPGPTTAGHYQIESQCELCHTTMTGVEQDACLACHAEELEQVDDSHPASKFLDPRNAGFVAKLDARLCISCHVEHRPEMTHEMGQTQPIDVCVHCHADIAEDRPTHAGMAFDTCQAAGCHNYHDNGALNEEFLSKHHDEPDVQPVPVVIVRTADNEPTTPLTRAHVDSPSDLPLADEIVDEWERTAHARAGVNCRDCHDARNPSQS